MTTIDTARACFLVTALQTQSDDPLWIAVSTNSRTALGDTDDPLDVSVFPPKTIPIPDPQSSLGTGRHGSGHSRALLTLVIGALVISER